MDESPLKRLRRRFGWVTAGLAVVGAVWWLTPGLPVLRAPRASAEVKQVGLTLFKHEWAPHDPMAKGDGLGPVFNGKSCAECHFQGGVGGAGDNAHNVLAFEAFPVPTRPEMVGGLIHHFAVDKEAREGRDKLRTFFPILPGGRQLVNGCQVIWEDFDPVHTTNVNTTALFGAGWIDRISGKTIRYQNMVSSASKLGQELTGDFRGAIPGRARVLPDGRVGKFGWKAQFATLEEFVAAACANEIGLGNPKMDQAKPWVRGADVKPGERDLSEGQFRSLVAFVDTLSRPIEAIPSSPGERRSAERGKAVFREVGCAGCHVPDIGGVAGVYSDFLLHRIDDPTRRGDGYRQAPPVPLPEDAPQPDEWKTPPLWGVADSAPYLHDGSAATLEAAVQRHRGDADGVYQAFQRLGSDDRGALFAFLRTLKAPTDALPPDPAPSRDRLAMAR
jgi:mono/diheme cytochrome c family protein